MSQETLLQTSFILTSVLLMKQVVRASFVDFWPGFDARDNFLISALQENFRVELVSRDPDLLFYSVFGTRNLRFAGRKILVNGEPHSSGYGRPSFSISCHESSLPYTFRLPNWAWDYRKELVVPSAERNPSVGSRFCNFVYSNPECEFRNRFFLALHSRKSVDSLGSVMNNSRSELLSARHASSWREAKIQVLQDYRFTLAFENCSQRGYSTEKIVDAFLAGSIPIYWGDPHIEEDFNPEAFINVSRFRSPSDAIDHILQVEGDPKAIHELRSQPPMSEEQLSRYSSIQLADFLTKCVGGTPPSRWAKISKAVAGSLVSVIQPRQRNPLASTVRRLTSHSTFSEENS